MWYWRSASNLELMANTLTKKITAGLGMKSVQGMTKKAGARADMKKKYKLEDHPKKWTTPKQSR